MALSFLYKFLYSLCKWVFFFVHFRKASIDPKPSLLHKSNFYVMSLNTSFITSFYHVRYIALVDLKRATVLRLIYIPQWPTLPFSPNTPICQSYELLFVHICCMCMCLCMFSFFLVPPKCMYNHHLLYRYMQHTYSYNTV